MESEKIRVCVKTLVKDNQIKNEWYEDEFDFDLKNDQQSERCIKYITEKYSVDESDILHLKMGTPDGKYLFNIKGNLGGHLFPNYWIDLSLEKAKQNAQ